MPLHLALLLHSTSVKLRKPVFVHIITLFTGHPALPQTGKLNTFLVTSTFRVAAQQRDKQTR